MAQEIVGTQGHENQGAEMTLTLEHARERLRFLLAGGERNAWEIGDLLNKIEKSGLVQEAAYKRTRTWLEANVPEAKDKVSSLYRYAHVAVRYSQADVDEWGVAKLYCLMIHDGETRDLVRRGDPAEREVQLVQANGSLLVKKFRDCTCRDLRLSQRYKTAPSEGEASPLQSLEVVSAQSIEFLKDQMANVTRQSRNLLWPFMHAG